MIKKKKNKVSLLRHCPVCLPRAESKETHCQALQLTPKPFTTHRSFSNNLPLNQNQKQMRLYNAVRYLQSRGIIINEREDAVYGTRIEARSTPSRLDRNTSISLIREYLRLAVWRPEFKLIVK